MALNDEQASDIVDEMIRVLKTIYDPEIPVDIFELGLIYEAGINEDGVANITMTLTTPNCPVAESMPAEVEQRISEVEGVTAVDLELTFDPPWNRDMMSEEAKFELGFF